MLRQIGRLITMTRHCIVSRSVTGEGRTMAENVRVRLKALGAALSRGGRAKQGRSHGRSGCQTFDRWPSDAERAENRAGDLTNPPKGGGWFAWRTARRRRICATRTLWQTGKATRPDARMLQETKEEERNQTDRIGTIWRGRE